ncbi:MAG: iron ABC transporter permease, partial [Chlorobi bacterium]|nr:iron ABC transporter permease [Chlorobiota bacterium]
AVAWKDFFYFFFGNSNLISSYFGVIFILTIIFTPLSMLIIGSALSNVNSQIEESGLLVSNLRRVIFKIILPLIKPALITSFVLVFIFAISEFSVPAFLGVKVFTTEIFTQFSAFYNHSLAILQSLFLVAICILLLFAEKKHLADAPFLSIGTKGTSNKIYDIKNLNIFAFVFLLFWFLISVILPFIILFIQSFKNVTSDFVKAFELLKPTFLNSFLLAFIGAIIIVVVGFVSAYHSVNQKNKNTFDWLLLFVFAIPSIVLGISFIKFYNQSFLNFIYSSTALIVIAYVGKFAFISSKIIGNSLKQISKSMEETAKVLGIKSFSRIFKILLPQISSALFATFIIGFILSFGELGTSIMLYPPGTEIMPIKVFTISANATQSLTSSMTLIVFSVTILLISFFYFLFLKIKNIEY